MVLSTTRTSGVVVVVVVVVETVDIKLHHQHYYYHYSFYSLVGAGAVAVAVVVVAKVELLLVVVAVEEGEFVEAWMECWHVEHVVVVVVVGLGCVVPGTMMALLVLCWRLLGVETAAAADAVVAAGRWLGRMHAKWMQQHPSPQPTMHHQPPELPLRLLILLLPKTFRKRQQQ
jgi:hypothetical protein